jgi:adenosylcobinamide amidohydrolase
MIPNGKKYLNNTHHIERNHAGVHVTFSSPCRVLSSAVLNGGFIEASHIFNMKVDKNPGGSTKIFDSSEKALASYCRNMGWEGNTVGMMTAANAESFSRVKRKEQGVEVTALVTAGISNARRAGDTADCGTIHMNAVEPGTVNIIMLTSARLTRTAMVEAVITVTEAKTAVFQNLDIRNPVTGSLATGTGTDAVAIASGPGPATVRFCGKHTLFGEMLASTVMEALTDSLSKPYSAE